MTSRIIVNNIQSDTGVSTVTISSPVNLSGGITGGGFAVGTGASITSPATNILTIGTNNTERIRVGAAGSIGIGTDNPSKFIDITGVHSGINTTGRFVMSPHAAGWDTGVTSGNIHHHYIDNFRLYSGQIGSGTERFKVDSNGYVTIPFQPAFRATATTSVTITSAQRLPYNSTSDSGGFDNTNSYNTSTYAFTAPVGGVYFFQASTYTDANTESMWDIRVNGNIRQRAELRQTAGDDIGDNTVINSSCIVSLAVGDVVDVYWSANTVQLIGGSGFISFSGAKIS
jgi:hypothetical protein